MPTGPKRYQRLGELGDVSPGPQSRPWEASGHEWLDERSNAGAVDAALNAKEMQKRMREVGASWLENEPDQELGPHGFMRRVGERKSLDWQGSKGPKERLGLQFNVVERDDSPRGYGEHPTRQEPVPHVYRGMSEAEFQEAQSRGFIQSDERGVIEPGWEGTNAGIDFGTAHSYLPREGPGRIVKIAVHPEDEWFTSNVGDYPRTRAQIPWSRVLAFTSTIDKSRRSNLREQVVEQQKREGRD